MDDEVKPKAKFRGRKRLVTAYVEPLVAKQVEERAKRLNWARAKTAGAIIEKWAREGCPPLSELEAEAARASPSPEVSKGAEGGKESGPNDEPRK